MEIYRPGILTKTEFMDNLNPDLPIERRLFISPLLESSQIGDTSIDLRLGRRFLVQKPSRMGLLDIVELHNQGESRLGENYSEHRVPYGHYFTLHPRSSVQIGTLEYLGIPVDLEGIVTLRSSFSNLPIMANAAQVHPGHRGIISFTLTSNAEFSIKLYPGTRFAELQLRHVLTPIEKPRTSRYHYMTNPQPIALQSDSDLEYLGPVAEPIIIGIVSTIASGRTTAISHLTERHGFAWFSLAHVLKAEAIKRGIPTLRSNLQEFGKAMREEHNDAYLATKLRTSDKWLMGKSTLVVVDSFKNVAEVDEFRKQKRFTLICIDAPLQLRWERVRSRRRQGDPTTFEDFEKQDSIDRDLNGSSLHGQQVAKLIEKADHTIANDGTIQDFIHKIDMTIARLTGMP